MAFNENWQADGSSYIPALDGVRAVSILLVVVSHAGIGLVPGLLGVTIFFFVSGYLITTQILNEISTARFRLQSFYCRRALRLYPALLVMVLIGGIAFAALGGSVTFADVASSVFYYANVHRLRGGFQTGLPHASHPYGVLWSLAVEEHYYLLFPVVAVLLARRRVAFIGFLVAAIALVSLWRFHIRSICGGGGGGGAILCG